MATGFNSLTELGASADEGRVHTAHFRKVPSQASVAGNWVDVSMAAGNPKPNYYASSPLTAAKLDKFDGILHGDDKAPYGMFLAALGVMSPSAVFVGRQTLLDYLLYYPFVDGDAAGEDQVMVNDLALDRYTSGDGVHVMAVAVAPTTGGGSFTYSYIDHAGNPQVSPTIDVNVAAANIATIVTSEQGNLAGGLPFLPMASGSLGVRSITQVNVIVPLGGLFALVMVKPLADTAVREINTARELDFVRQRGGMPKIEDGAYLNFIAQPAGSLATAILAGWATFVWSK